MYLPAGWHGSKSVQFVKGPPDAGRGRFFILNEMGVLHLVSPRDDFRVEWSLRLQGSSIIEFNCDCNGKYLVVISSDGRIILYDIPTLNSIIANKNKTRRAAGFGGEESDIKLT